MKKLSMALDILHLETQHNASNDGAFIFSLMPSIKCPLHLKRLISGMISLNKEAERKALSITTTLFTGRQLSKNAANYENILPVKAHPVFLDNSRLPVRTKSGGITKIADLYMFFRSGGMWNFK